MPEQPEAITGSNVLADLFAEYGTSHIFQVPAVIRRTLVELEFRHPDIQRVTTHGEKSAAYMADGYARVSGRPGVCAAQVVGALNLAAGLREPFLANSPVIAITGGRIPATKFRNVYQEVDDVPAFEPVTKFNATIDDVSRFDDMFRQAYRVATTGCPGPVHIQIQGNEGQLDAQTVPADAVRHTTASGFDARFASAPAFRPTPDEEAIGDVLRVIHEADRPVIVAGGGVRASQAGAALTAFAEALSVPVVTSANGKDTVPGSHPLVAGVVGTYSRESANQVVARADLVVFVGSKTGGMTTHFWSLPRLDVPVVQIDIDPEAMGRNYRLAAGVLADAGRALARLCARSGELPARDRSTWLAEVETLKVAWRDKYRTVMTSDAVPMRPERVCAELTDLLPADSIVLVDTGHAGMWMAQFHETTSAEQSYLRAAGHLGWAFPAGIGAKAAAPDRATVVFTGDSGLYYHLGEIETAVRNCFNSITVVNNNAGGNQSKRGFDRVYDEISETPSRGLWTFLEADLAAIAEQMGALGIVVERPEDLGPAFEQALEADRPVVIDVRTDVEATAPAAVSG